MIRKSLEELQLENDKLRQENAVLRNGTALATRDRIYAAAVGVLAEKGWHADLKDFTQAAGIGNSTFYRHFSTRDGLVREVASAMAGEVRERSQKLMCHSGDSLDIFIEWAWTGFEMVERYGRLAVQVCFPEEVPDYLTDVVDTTGVHRFTGWIVKKCKAEGLCRKDHTTPAIVATWFSLCHPHRIRWGTGLGFKRQEIFAETLTVFFRAYSTDPDGAIGRMQEKLAEL